MIRCALSASRGVAAGERSCASFLLLKVFRSRLSPGATRARPRKPSAEKEDASGIASWWYGNTPVCLNRRVRADSLTYSMLNVRFLEAHWVADGHDDVRYATTTHSDSRISHVSDGSLCKALHRGREPPVDVWRVTSASATAQEAVLQHSAADRQGSPNTRRPANSPQRQPRYTGQTLGSRHEARPGRLGIGEPRSHHRAVVGLREAMP